jgi:hypothetical protein
VQQESGGWCRLNLVTQPVLQLVKQEQLHLEVRLVRAAGWEAHFRIEVLSKAGVGALAISARADNRNSSLAQAVQSILCCGLSFLRLSLPQFWWLLLLPSPLPDTANDIQLIQHKLVHYKPLGWQRCFSECSEASTPTPALSPKDGTWSLGGERGQTSVYLPSWVPRTCWVPDTHPLCSFQ